MEQLFLDICNQIKEMKLEDTGYKEGIKTTSYEYTTEDGICLKMWNGDAETCKTLLLDDEKVGTWYDCWGNVKFEYNSDMLHKLKKRMEG